MTAQGWFKSNILVGTMLPESRKADLEDSRPQYIFACDPLRQASPDGWVRICLSDIHATQFLQLVFFPSGKVSHSSCAHTLYGGDRNAGNRMTQKHTLRNPLEQQQPPRDKLALPFLSPSLISDQSSRFGAQRLFLLSLVSSGLGFASSCNSCCPSDSPPNAPWA